MMKVTTSTAPWGAKRARQGTTPLLPSAKASSLPWVRSSNPGSGGRRKAARSLRKLQKVRPLFFSLDVRVGKYVSFP